MSVLRYALAPWWVAQLATGAKAFGDNPLLGSPRLNGWGLHAARVRLADVAASRRRRALARLVPSADRAAFDRDGFVERRDFLAPAGFAALRDAVLDYPGAAREMTQGDTVTRRIALEGRALRDLPQAAALLRHPDWRGLIRYVGSHDAEPLAYVQTILTGARPGAPDPQTALHADTFHATVKAWFFLTDVAADEGPFTYVPGSHRLTPERLRWERDRSVRGRNLDRLSSRGSLRIEPDELPALALPAPRAFSVPANTLIVADTHGFHARGPSGRPSTRVEIWAYGRRNPFRPWAGLDWERLPGLADRRIALMWGARDRLAPLIGQPWRDVGPRRPADPAAL